MRRTWILLAACLALLLGACGDDGGTETGSGATGEATTTSAAAATGDGVAAGDAPQRIVSLSPTATEVLFAIGAGDQVVAVDELSDYPEGTPVTDLSGYEPSLEAIASYDPDLVVSSYDPGDLVTGLTEIGVEVVTHGPAATLEDSYAQITELGEVTGHPEEAAALVTDIQQRIEEAAAEVAADAPAEPISVYHEVDDTFYSASSSSFLGEVYELLGLENIADEADTGGTGFPQLNAEYIIEADPDLIVITDEGGYTEADVAARPGWDAITAVAEGDVVQVDADLASRWGPRVADFVELIADHVSEMQSA